MSRCRSRPSASSCFAPCSAVGSLVWLQVQVGTLLMLMNQASLDVSNERQAAEDEPRTRGREEGRGEDRAAGKIQQVEESDGEWRDNRRSASQSWWAGGGRSPLVLSRQASLLAPDICFPRNDEKLRRRFRSVGLLPLSAVFL